MQKKGTKEIEHWIEQAHHEEIFDLIHDLDDVSISDHLENLLQIKALSKAVIIRNSALPRSYAYQIFQGTKHASRDKLLQLAYAMQLTLEEANQLLKIAKYSPLYAKQKRDAVLIFTMRKQMNIYQTNEYLEGLQLPLLGYND